MSSKLFAFQVATPVEAPSQETWSAEYDPSSQMLIWQGGSRAQAIHCTSVNTGWYSCNSYGDYCSTWGGQACCAHGNCMYLCD